MLVGITEKRSPIANKRFFFSQQEINFGERERGGNKFVERERERDKKYCTFITTAQESETL